MIHAHRLSYNYNPTTQIFQDYDWHVSPGESWAVLGPSGCGKTTLLYLLAGLRFPTHGSITIGNQELDRPRPRTGLILQDYGLLPWSTVRENTSLGLRVRGFYGPDGKHAPEDDVVKTVRERVDPWLDRLGLAPVADQYPGQLSGGQRQRAAIARTLVLNPDLLLMDEPFASLDAPTREGLQNLVLELHDERKLTTVIVTHAIEEAALLGKKILLLSSPPNMEAKIFENSQAGSEYFRDTPAYHSLVAELRTALDEKV
jgi:ABC-type nitrate/sulfonate/bicarbonate transport system ATPase subunit